MYFLTFSLLLAVASSTNICDTTDSDCPACPASHPLQFQSTLWTSGLNGKLTQNIKAGQQAVKALAPDKVFELDSWHSYHITLNYFCCYNQSEVDIITRVLQEFKWSSFEITLDDFGCNLDHNGFITYLHAKPREQDQLFSLIKGIEGAITRAGVKVNTPRQQAFHNTFGRVIPGYPVEKAVATFNSTLWGSFRFDWFVLSEQTFIYAQDFA